MRLIRPPGAARTWTAYRRRGRDDRGSTAVEFAIGAPVIVGLLLLLVQAFFFGMGSLAAHAAADHGAQTARVHGGSAAAGQADATELLHQLGGWFVDDPTVTVHRGAETTTVTISGTVHGLPVPVTATVRAPTERVTP
ncbi:TadE/TadG family type IV pilus assembly protein [Micromonospora sp. NBC_01813]|uniref:TadE/TadG family type IV pilus assembly protein n=1 Tax=Micromonospora sp. NBC_01813 TaxID=2975988 RepID=UPI002DDC0B88|nr:TadE/TadG family type IV pilus assembly protein [Micromonospora sp. NBC_01813]WSA06965.1 pilus assembly protein [Micromonospora sp. NBC_01813]